MVPSASAARLSGSTVSEWRCFLVRTDSKWVRTVAEKRGTRSYCTSAVGNFARLVRTQIHSNGSKCECSATQRLNGERVEVFSGSNGFEMGENGCGEERDALLLYLCCRQFRAAGSHPDSFQWFQVRVQRDSAAQR